MKHTTNMNLRKPDYLDLADISDINYNMDVVDSQLADLTTYQTPTIVGTEIQIVQQGTGSRLYFKLDTDLTGGAITISKDGGSTSKPLKDIEGAALTQLDKGFVEVVENDVNFTYAPKGGKNQGAVIITPSTTNIAIPKGIHNGLGYVQGSANLVPANIKSGVNVFGVVGTNETQINLGSIPTILYDVTDNAYDKAFLVELRGLSSMPKMISMLGTDSRGGNHFLEYIQGKGFRATTNGYSVPLTFSSPGTYMTAQNTFNTTTTAPYLDITNNKYMVFKVYSDGFHWYPIMCDRYLTTNFNLQYAIII